MLADVWMYHHTDFHATQKKSDRMSKSPNHNNAENLSLTRSLNDVKISQSTYLICFSSSAITLIALIVSLCLCRTGHPCAQDAMVQARDDWTSLSPIALIAFAHITSLQLTAFFLTSDWSFAQLYKKTKQCFTSVVSAMFVSVTSLSKHTGHLGFQ